MIWPIEFFDIDIGCKRKIFVSKFSKVCRKAQIEIGEKSWTIFQDERFFKYELYFHSTFLRFGKCIRAVLECMAVENDNWILGKQEMYSTKTISRDEYVKQRSKILLKKKSFFSYTRRRKTLARRPLIFALL